MCMCAHPLLLPLETVKVAIMSTANGVFPNSRLNVSNTAWTRYSGSFQQHTIQQRTPIWASIEHSICMNRFDSTVRTAGLQKPSTHLPTHKLPTTCLPPPSPSPLLSPLPLPSLLLPSSPFHSHPSLPHKCINSLIHELS